MGKSSTSTYVCQNRHGTYYARLIIPRVLQSQFINKREIRRSLQTDSRRLAIQRARAYRVQFEILLDELMGTKNDISNKAKKIVDEILSPKKKTDQFGESPETAILHEPANDDGTRIKLITFVDLQGNTTAIDYDGDFEKEIQAYQLIRNTQESPVSLSIPSTGKTFNEYFNEYDKYQTRPDIKDGWKSESTAIKKRGMLSCFLSQYGTMNAADFTWQDAKQYTKLARTLPPFFTNPSHKAKFTGLTIHMLLDDSVDTSMYGTRKPSAIWNDLKTIRAFLEWIRAEDRIKELRDAIEELDKEIGRTHHDSARRAFTTEELKVLFDQDNAASENYIKGFNSKRGINANLKFWLPLLGLYTGATLAELCQLHLSDIYLHKAFDGSEHWVFDLNEDEAKGKRLKNTEHRPRLIVSVQPSHLFKQDRAVHPCYFWRG
jgi:integrase